MRRHGIPWLDWHRWTTVPYYRYFVIRTYHWARWASFCKTVWCAITDTQFDRRFNVLARDRYLAALKAKGNV